MESSEINSMSGLVQCPSDVLEMVMRKVISVLPAADLCRLRTVSKEWNEIITTRAFQANGQLRFNKEELLAICDIDCSHEFKAYDVEAERWHSFDLSFLPDAGDDGFRVLDFAGGLACVIQTTGMKRQYTTRVEFPLLPVSDSISYVEDSLLSFIPLSKRDVERALYVCNPLTKRWAQLPPPSSSLEDEDSSNSISYELVIVRTYYYRKMGHYKVFLVSAVRVKPHKVVNWPLNQLVVKEFDSTSWEWIVHSQTCHGFWWMKVTGVGVLPCNYGNSASLFILLDSFKPRERQVFELLFDEDKGASAFVKIGASLPSNLLNPTMVCCELNPRPLLVSVVGDGDEPTGIEIWELDNQLTEWTNLAAMPSDLFTHYKSLYSETFSVFHGPREAFSPTRVVAVPYKHLVYVHDESAMSWTITYDTLTRSWLWMSTKLPPEINAEMLPQVNKWSGLSGVRGCAFEPSLANVVPTDTDGSN